MAAGTNNGCRPNPSYANDSQYSSARRFALRWPARLIREPAFVVRVSFRVSYAYSKALDNVGEFFFSAPIDNYNLWLDYGRSDDDQRHRLVFDATLRTPPRKRRDRRGKRAAYGFQLSTLVPILFGAAVQHHYRRQYDSGDGCASRSEWRLHRAQCRDRIRLSQPRGPAQPRRPALRARPPGSVSRKGFNLTNHLNGVTRNGVFGTGAFPANPSSSYQQVTAVNDSRSLQFALKVHF